MKSRILSLLLFASIALSTVYVTATAAAPQATPVDPLVVSLTFDDGYRSQLEAADQLTAHGMQGTFYVNSGSLNFPAYFTVEELQEVAAAHEIGGHGINHERLDVVGKDAMEDEICGDRAALARLGVPPKNFAYPYGTYNADVVRIVAECGYNSARTTSGLYVGPGACEGCPTTESLELTHRYNIRTSQNIDNSFRAEDLIAQVQTARADGAGGWLPMVFHEFCESGQICDPYATHRAEFNEFIDWLAVQPDVEVATVGQVVGGDFRAIVGEPPAQVGGVVFDEVARRDTLSQATAFWGIGQQQLIIGFIIISIAAIVAFRAATRGRRYHTTREPSTLPQSR